MFDPGIVAERSKALDLRLCLKLPNGREPARVRTSPVPFLFFPCPLADEQSIEVYD